MRKTQSRMTEDLLIEKKIEILVGMQTKQLHEEIKELKNIIVALNDEVVSIKGHLKNNAVQREKEEVKVEKVEVQKEAEKQATIQVSGDGENNHHRTGDFEPGDVRIEEMFYFGKK